MSAQQFDYIRRHLAAAQEAASRARDEVGNAYSALRAVAEAEAAEQDKLRSELQQQQQQHRQELQQQHEQHQQQQLAQQQQHEQHQQQQLAQQQHEQQLAAAVAAATAAEKARLWSRVAPAFTALQTSGRLQRGQLAAKEAEVAAKEAEVVATRELVFELLDKPAATRRRLGF
jgi:hypothetical protein